MLNIGKQLNAEERLSKAIVAVMGSPKYTALAGVLMLGEKTIDEDVPTACTNGRDEKYGRAFVDELTDAELRGLLLHENYHKLYSHLTTWRHLYDINPQLANVACDYVINLKIMDDNKDGFATLPEGGLIDEKYRDMDTAQVFNLLRKEQATQPPGGSGGSDSQDNESGSGSGQADGLENGTLQSGAGLDQHDWDGAQELSDEEKRELARDIDEAIRQGALAAGKMGGTGNRDLDALLQPQVDWREVLREFVQATCAGSDYSTYSRPNRRLMSQGIYMPSGISERVEELVIAIDTSGSIGQSELTEFLSEVKGVCDTVKPNKVRLLYWGCSVVGDESYDMHELEQLTTSTKPKGGGGTDVRCVTQYMAKKSIKPQAAIVLTDGYLFGGWGEWTCPVLWTILDNEHALADVGKTVHIKARDM